MAQPTARPDTTTSFIVSGTDVNGCEDTAQQRVSVTGIKSIAGDTTICPGDSARLFVGPTGSSVRWRPAAGLSAPQDHQPKAAPGDSIIYTAEVTYSGGCVDTDTVSVGVFPSLNTQAGPDTTLCRGADSLQLNVRGGDLFSWQPGTGLSADSGRSVMARPDTSTTYQVIARDTSTGCRDTATAAYRFFQNPPEAAFSLPERGFTDRPVTITNNSRNASTYTWQFEGGAPPTAQTENPPAVAFAQEGSYLIILSVKDEKGCRDSLQKTLEVVEPVNVKVPSVFTPNGDGINDAFKPQSPNPLSDYRLVIYSRKGRQVFSSNDFGEGWDGRLPGGQQATEGSYTFYMQGTNLKGTRIERSGHITLLR
jgi:gliding motility-associated-like protein